MVVFEAKNHSFLEYGRIQAVHRDLNIGLSSLTTTQEKNAKMDKLTKAQKDEMATSFAVLALYDGGAEVTSAQINTLLEATGNTEVEGFYPIIFANFLSSPDKIAELIASPGGVGGGAAAAGGAAAGDEAEAEAAEEAVEEEEAPMGGGMDMFGGGDDGGDY